MIEVEDTGIGIQPEALDRIFSPFDQADNSITRRFGGLGLGLVIVKGIMDLHKGTIAVTSEGRDKGTTFTLELEALPAIEDRPPAPPIKDALPAVPQRILLVEDHPDTLRVMARLLKSLGYGVVTAASVAEALHQMDAEEFDLLVSDIGLPDGSGLDIMRENGIFVVESPAEIGDTMLKALKGEAVNA